MAYISIKDAAGVTRYLEVSGAGTTVDPYVPNHTIEDGGGSITVDGPLTDAQIRATALPISAASLPSHAVTNAGTFLTQENGGVLTALQLIDNMISGSEAQVDIVASLPAGDNNIGNMDIVSGPTGASALAIQGTVAHDAAAAQNPILNGAYAVSAEPTAVANADVARLITDLVGKLIVLPYSNPENLVSGATGAIVDTARTSLIAAQGSGVRTYITTITIQNSHPTVGTWVFVEDGTTAKYKVYCAPLGGGVTITFNSPLVGTANVAWSVSCQTTGANVVASASGYKGI